MSKIDFLSLYKIKMAEALKIVINYKIALRYLPCLRWSGGRWVVDLEWVSSPQRLVFMLSQLEFSRSWSHNDLFKLERS